MNALMIPTVRQIAAQVEVVLRHAPEARVVGIRSTREDRWPERLSVQGREFMLAWCASPLAIRERMVELERNPPPPDSDSAPGLVVLTPLTDREAGLDVLARLARGRIFAVESWEVVRGAFQAKEADPRLARWPWVAEALLEGAPAGGYPPAPGGFLDAETAWGQVLRMSLGLPTARPDLVALLQWSIAPESGRRLAALPDSARRQVCDWLGEGVGSAGRLAVTCIQAGSAAELLPLAWICGILFAPEEGGGAAHERLAAAVRLERYTGGTPVGAEEGRLFHRAAVQLGKQLDEAALRPALEYADRLAEVLHIGQFVHLSDDLPSGMEARLAAFATALGSYLDSPGRTASQAVEAARLRVKRHRLYGRQPMRTAKMEMTARLVRWLERSSRSAAGLGEAVTGFSAEGSFVDWARFTLLGGDESAAVSAAYTRLGAVVRQRREEANREFGRLLRAWNESGCPAVQGVVPVERVIQEVVAPLAEVQPVLLLVVDGLSLAIFRELLDDLLRQGWEELLPTGRGASVGLATIPSITEVSRTSLLCGRLATGQAPQEKSAFTQHPALLAACRSGGRPVLFHKGELAGDNGLSSVVREALSARASRVVGVVFNGVDDHLSGGDQLAHRWGLDDLRLIRALLFEARDAGRVVALTADHGHVLEESTVLRGGDQGDRWRSGGGPAGEGEVELAGGRVVTVDGQNRGIFPWSESIRYGGKKNGYHGGVTLQEMVVPIALLAALPKPPAGYEAAPPTQPDWWEETLPPPAQEPAPPVRPAAPSRRRKAPDTPQPDLFGGTEEPVATPASATGVDDWIGRVLSSAVFLSQRQLAARAALRDEEVRALLEALAERGGKLSKTALAQRLGMPAWRVSGFVNNARRLLNVDQSAVVTLDETEGVVALNRELLKVQFQVGAW